MFSSYAKAMVTLGMIVLAFITNALSNVIPLNGQNVGEISNTVFGDVLLTPANYAFAIWGIIYIGLFAFGIYQFSPRARHNPSLNPLRLMMMIACGAQIGWIFIFLSRQYLLSLVAMLVIWVALFLGYFKVLDIKPLNRQQLWSVQIPWSLYLSWISVAMMVNVALSLSALGWQGGFLAPEIWTVGLVIVAMVIGIIVVWVHCDIAFSGVFIWALLAIALRHSESSLLFNTGVGCAIALVCISAFRGFKSEAM